MSDEEFLARWSRRKQEARDGHADAPPPTEPAEAHEPGAGRAPGRESGCRGAWISRACRRLNSIDAATDITAFLRKGIPQELSRAALRRAWSADPAIRDFVGLAENAWDFNDPNAMPGFGPLDYSAEQLDALGRPDCRGRAQSRREPCDRDRRAAQDRRCELGSRRAALAQSQIR